ncbi:MAG: mechanosensitive ion channel family protein [Alloprevotella sp.]
MNELKTLTSELIRLAGFPDSVNEQLTFFLLCGLAAALTGLLSHLLRTFFTPFCTRWTKKTDVVWDDYLLNPPVLNATWHLLGAVIFFQLLPYCYTQAESAWYVFVEQATKIFITLCATRIVTAFLTNLAHYTTEQEASQKHALVGITQFLKLLTYCICGIIVISFIFGRNPISIIAGLGAAATVLMLVFKDTILGLVAGIQLSANRMMKPGDWVTIEKLHVNGIVEQMSLTTVKIRNFDNTISTVPPYTLVSDVFHNWTGMYDSGSRSVKRALLLDSRTIRFLSKEDVEELEKKKLVLPEDCQGATGENGGAAAETVNLALFRAYATRHLASLPVVDTDTWVLVRQLESTPQGLPLEFWFYLKETDFVRYENLASQIFEHFIAMLPHFGLRLFQAPAGDDLRLYINKE